ETPNPNALKFLPGLDISPKSPVFFNNFDEAKANGFDVKTMKQIIKLRKLDKNKLAEQDAILELYRQALEV
ncbi:MAG: DUF2312 domain-containing protein, partial [Alphaproteobacteria bacterium]|nr:DUF2312 domain-containing protein [Alphaproteobacteria bacterium]